MLSLVLGGGVLTALLYTWPANAQSSHLVLVGASNPPSFDPTNVTAAAGDKIIFGLPFSVHRITQSTFENPCKALSGGVDTGPLKTTYDAAWFSTYTLTVQNQSSLWFFDNQSNNCASGAVFAVNPSASQTFSAFQAKALNGKTLPSTPASSSPSATSGGSAVTVTATASSSTRNDKTAVILGSVLGTFLGIFVIAALALFCLTRRRPLGIESRVDPLVLSEPANPQSPTATFSPEMMQRVVPSIQDEPLSHMQRKSPAWFSPQEATRRPTQDGMTLGTVGGSSTMIMSEMASPASPTSPHDGWTSVSGAFGRVDHPYRPRAPSMWGTESTSAYEPPPAYPSRS